MKIGGRVDALTRVLRKISVSVSKEGKAITMNHRYLSKPIIPFQICQIWTCMLFCCSRFGRRRGNERVVCLRSWSEARICSNLVLRYIDHGVGRGRPLNKTRSPVHYQSKHHLHPHHSYDVLSSRVDVLPEYSSELSRLLPGHRRVHNQNLWFVDYTHKPAFPWSKDHA